MMRISTTLLFVFSFIGFALVAANISAQPIFLPQGVEGQRLSTVHVPITVQDLENINEFQFDVTWFHAGMLAYVGVEDIYPGVSITAPGIGENTLSASYDGESLTLPGNTVLFHIAFDLY